MADYIKREYAINAIESLPTWWADEGGYYGGMQQPRVALLEPEDVITATRNIPSADVVEVRHGEWLPDVYAKDAKTGYEYTVFKCSECGGGCASRNNFCHRCGADMRTEGGTRVYS